MNSGWNGNPVQDRSCLEEVYSKSSSEWVAQWACSARIPLMSTAPTGQVCAMYVVYAPGCFRPFMSASGMKLRCKCLSGRFGSTCRSVSAIRPLPLSPVVSVLKPSVSAEFFDISRPSGPVVAPTASPSPALRAGQAKAHRPYVW